MKITKKASGIAIATIAATVGIVAATPTHAISEIRCESKSAVEKRKNEAQNKYHQCLSGIPASNCSASKMEAEKLAREEFECQNIWKNP